MLNNPLCVVIPVRYQQGNEWLLNNKAQLDLVSSSISFTRSNHEHLRIQGVHERVNEMNGGTPVKLRIGYELGP